MMIRQEDNDGKGKCMFSNVSETACKRIDTPEEETIQEKRELTSSRHAKELRLAIQEHEV